MKNTALVKWFSIVIIKKQVYPIENNAPGYSKHDELCK